MKLAHSTKNATLKSKSCNTSIGTEPIIRLMIESQNVDLAQNLLAEITE